MTKASAQGEGSRPDPARSALMGSQASDGHGGMCRPPGPHR
ncbi:hypothetical protein F8B43_4240 [Methylorubrum populi]|uniref:Uncharacterized protein n=1 Tax=Methylorubrum populi TaxID=223967 RepID=A0A833J3G5_9HYPH|nr:hypothetical protein F8B43_4240 [Methylorubrum populi]